MRKKKLNSQKLEDILAKWPDFTNSSDWIKEVNNAALMKISFLIERSKVEEQQSKETEERNQFKLKLD